MCVISMEYSQEPLPWSPCYVSCRFLLSILVLAFGETKVFVFTFHVWMICPHSLISHSFVLIQLAGSVTAIIKVDSVCLHKYTNFSGSRFRTKRSLFVTFNYFWRERWKMILLLLILHRGPVAWAIPWLRAEDSRNYRFLGRHLCDIDLIHKRS